MIDIQMPLWERYSKKILNRLDHPRYAGFFTASEAALRGMRLVLGRAKTSAVEVCLYWLIDESDGVIADVLYQAIGPTALVAAAEAACDLIMRKNYDQASRLSVELIDRSLRDTHERPAFPDECTPFLQLILEAIDAAAEQCRDIPVMGSFEMTPIEEMEAVIPGGFPDWEQMATEQKRQIIEGVIEKEIRPYIALDAGGIEVRDLLGDEVTVVFQGACAACPASVGSTLDAIQRILRSRVHHSLSVIAELFENKC